MGARSAVSDTVDTLQRNPVLMAGALVVAVAGTLANYSSFFLGVFAYLFVFVYFFVEPLFAGGFLGMANEGVDGETSLGAFWDHGTDNFFELLAARLLVGMVAFGYYLASYFVVVFVAAIAGVSAGVFQSDPSSVAAVGSIYVVGGLVALGLFGVAAVAGMALQFYPAAIVVGDAGPIESFKYSFDLFREHPASVLAYSAITAAVAVGVVVVVYAVFFAVAGGVGVLTSPTGTGFSTDPVASLLLLAVGFTVGFSLLRTVQIGVLRTYYVAFVRSLVS